MSTVFSRSMMFKDRFKPDPEDFVIVVMGPTGSGKTNFINKLTGNVEHRRAASLRSDTENVTPYFIPYKNSRLVLVDTPGFNDTYRPDSEILRIIADWLTQKYSNGATLKVAGITYLHRITDPRMSGSAYKNLQMFGRLCGDIPLRRTCLVTTMWDGVKGEGVAKEREKQLKSEFWKKLVDEGATSKRFYNTSTSAWDIIEGLSMEKEVDELLLQEELINQQKRLNETEAGKVLFSQLQKLLEEQRKMLKDFAEQARLQNDPALAKSMQEEYERIDALLQRTFEEIKGMKISLPRRILLWMLRRKPRAKAVDLDYLQT